MFDIPAEVCSLGAWQQEVVAPDPQPTNTTMKNRMRYTTTTIPAIAKCHYPATRGCYAHDQWKVSPWGPDQPDRDALWCDSREEAEGEAAASVIGTRQQLHTLSKGLIDLHVYLSSAKFHTDTTVQVADIFSRLDEIQALASDFACDVTNTLLAGNSNE